MKAYRKVDDTYEFRVDSGRLVLLGVGAGLVVCLVFLLGVLVGRGLWSRRPAPVELAAEPAEGVAPPAPPVSEPERRQPELTFYKDLKTSEPGPGLAEPSPVPPQAPAGTGTAVPPSGVAKRSVKPPAPAKAATKPRARAPIEKRPVKRVPPAVFTVQVGSFRDRADAVELAGKVGSQGVHARVVDASVAGRTWYRVQVGRFDTRSGAETHYRKHLEPRGIQGFVTTR